MRLKGGHETSDSRLGRVPSFDERSRGFPIRSLVPADIRGGSWYCAPRYNQKSESSCVGFGWTHELAAFPTVVKTSEDLARQLYREAQTLDEWPGEEPDVQGSSVLAGAKAVKLWGFITEYRWAFGLDDVLRAISHSGPVVLGTDWTDTMFSPRPSGLMDVEGSVAGGHCYLARGILLKPRLTGEPGLGPIVRCRNSWGYEWGRQGDFFLRVEDLERLLHQEGEACVPIGRKRALR